MNKAQLIILTAVFSTVTSLLTISGCNSQKETPDTQSEITNLVRTNFISTLNEIGNNPDVKYLALMDFNHFSLEIQELVADSAVIATAKNNGFNIIVLEDAIEENQGFEEPIAEYDEHLLNSSLMDISFFLHDLGYGIEEEYDLAAIDNAIMAFVEDVQSNPAFDWQKPISGVYTRAFGKQLEEKIFQLYPQQQKEDGAERFLSALKYLKDLELLSISPTNKAIYQQLQSGDITREEYIDFFRPWDAEIDSVETKRTIQAFLDNLYYSGLHDVEIYYPDERYAVLAQYPEMTAVFEQMVSRTTDDNEFKDMVIENAYLNYAQINGDTSYVRAARQFTKFIEFTLSDEVNSRIVENIKTFAGSEKAIILYGAAHFHEENDMDEFLRDSTVTIALFPNSDFFTWRNENPNDSGNKMQDLPDYFYEIAEDNMVKISDDSAAQNQYWAHTKTFMTQEEYLSYVQNLPDSMKAYALPYTEYDSDYTNDQYGWVNEGGDIEFSLDKN